MGGRRPPDNIRLKVSRITTQGQTGIPVIEANFVGADGIRPFISIGRTAVRPYRNMVLYHPNYLVDFALHFL